MMRALLLALPLAACGLPGPIGEAFCPGDFALNNQSGRAVEQLYAGGGRDLLEPDVLAPGQSRRFQAAAPGAARLRVVFDDGRATEIGPLDLCRLPRVTVTQGGIQAEPA